MLRPVVLIDTIIVKKRIQAWWCTIVLQAVRRLRQEVQLGIHSESLHQKKKFLKSRKEKKQAFLSFKNSS